MRTMKVGYIEEMCLSFQRVCHNKPNKASIFKERKTKSVYAGQLE